MIARRRRLHRTVIALLIAAVLAFFSPEPFAVLAAVAAFVAILALLWVAEEPPILLIAPVLQWSQVALVPLATVWTGQPMLAASTYGGQTTQAALYGLAGVTALALGMRMGLGNRRRGFSLAAEMQAEALAWSRFDILTVSIIAILAGYLFGAGQSIGGGLSEPLHQASAVKYGGLFLLVYWSITTGRLLKLMGAVVVVDLFLGMTGFFADFIGSALVICAASGAALSRMRLRDVAGLSIFTVLIVMTGIFWSAVKPDYRNFVSLGTGQQIVAVPFSARVNYLIDRIIAFDGEDMSRGADAMVARHGYTEFLGLTLQNVPDRVAHENGALTLAALRHITTPRILFPEKPPLPWDTDVMTHYTGLPHVWDRRTSISIGHLGELYIDFGLIGGIMAMAVWGYVIARGYAFIRDDRRCPSLLRAAVCAMIMLPVAYFGTALAKVIGAFVFAMIIATFTQRIAMPFLFQRVIARVRRRTHVPIDPDEIVPA